MADKILFKRSLEHNKEPLVSDLLLGELAINIYDGKIHTRRQYLADGDPVEEIVSFVSKVPVGNALYVSVNGDDENNDGESWDRAFASIEAAIAAAWLRNGTPTLIDIGPGTYYTQGHIDMPDNCAIRAVHRTVFVRPVAGYEQRNIFRMGSGCFIEGVMVEGFEIDDFDNPTEGFAFSFRPGAVITRAPYAHKCAIRRMTSWDYIVPPLDRANGNPLVGRGGGVVLADGKVCSPYSIYPNIMTWGATPVTQNGIGYCAKNGALINAVNAVSLWAHKHFYAIDGGQIILSSCSTQFGDYTMIAKGVRQLIDPMETNSTYVIDPQAPSNSIIPQVISYTASSPLEVASGDFIMADKQLIIDGMWQYLVDNGYVTGWGLTQEEFTKRDAGNLINAIVGVLQTGDLRLVTDFARGLIKADGTLFIPSDKIVATTASFEYMNSYIDAMGSVTTQAKAIVSSQFDIAIAVASSTSYIVKNITDSNTIIANESNIIDTMWTALVDGGYTAGWTAQDETYTRRDAGLLIQALVAVLNTGDQRYMDSFISGLFDNTGTPVFSNDKLNAFIYSFDSINQSIAALAIDSSTINNVDSQIVLLEDTLTAPSTSAAVLQILAAAEIGPVAATIVDDMWNALVAADYTIGWTAQDETYTRRDAADLINTIVRFLQTGNEWYLENFTRGLFWLDATSVIDPAKKSAFTYCFDFINTAINLLTFDASVKTTVNNIFLALYASLDYPVSFSTALTVQPEAAVAIIDPAMIDSMWYQLFREGLTTGWPSYKEGFTRRDAATLLGAISKTLETGDQSYVINFVKSIYYADQTAVFPSNELDAFLFCFRFMRDYIYGLTGVCRNAGVIVDECFTSIEFTLRYPSFTNISLSPQATDAATIIAAKQTIIDNMWTALVNGGYTVGWDSLDETYTRRDAGNMIQSLSWVLQTANEKPMLDLAKGFYDTKGLPVFSSDKTSAFTFAWNTIRDEITALNINNTSKDIISSLVASLIYTSRFPSFLVQPSTITAIGHTWTAVLAGVALTKIPPVLNEATIQDSILELEQGVVIASGQDDQGSALFVGGMQINADTGELSGPPFDTAVNRIATKTAISRSF